MPDLPETVDLRWIGRAIQSMQQEIRALRDDAARNFTAVREDMQGLRDHVDVVVASNLRIERSQSALRDDISRLFEMQRDLRQRLEALEGPPSTAI